MCQLFEMLLNNVIISQEQPAKSGLNITGTIETEIRLVEGSGIWNYSDNGNCRQKEPEGIGQMYI